MSLFFKKANYALDNDWSQYEEKMDKGFYSVLSFLGLDHLLYDYDGLVKE